MEIGEYTYTYLDIYIHNGARGGGDPTKMEKYSTSFSKEKGHIF